VFIATADHAKSSTDIRNVFETILGDTKQMSCPSEEDLAALLGGDLNAVEQSTLELHVERCGECNLLWRRLVGSSHMRNGSANRGIARDNSETSTRPPEVTADPANSNSGALAPHSPLREAVGHESPGAVRRADDIGPSRDAATLAAALVPTVLERVIPAQADDEPHLGQRVGRYQLRALLGSGGMGRVYAARDPELDRAVAIKVLRADVDTQNAHLRARLVREAQAMARLSHPNVISVHDVGLHGDHVFIAMELIDGQTLRQWLDERPRPWQDVLRVVVQAGRGLGAAHKAGIVHRDFKPDNVMIGRSGSVRVLDFGLARGVVDESSSPGADGTGSMLKRSLTGTGGFIGTPSFMAPEQFHKLAATPQSDQFSFCVVLYRAIWGEAPFAGDSMDVLAEAVINGRLRVPSKSGRVPMWLRDAVLRGLANDPAQRWPSMDALLATLTRSPMRTRQRRIIASVTAATLIALALGYRDLRRRESLVCRGAEHKLVAIWDDARKQKMHAAFVATNTPFAEDTFRGAARALDAYASAWVKAHTEACEATRVRREQSEELLDLRMECLAQRLQEAKAQLELLTTADAKTVEKAVQMTSALSPVSDCSDVAALRAPVRPPNEAVRAQVAALRDRLARVKALHDAGRYADARAQALTIADVARKLGYRPLMAEALLALGRSQIATGQTTEAEKSLDEATLAAEAGRADTVLAEALIQLMRAVGSDQQRAADGKKLADRVLAVIERVGSDDRLRARFAEMRGYRDVFSGQYQEALAHGQQALALWQKIPDAPPTELARGQLLIGTALQTMGRYRDAIPYLRRALALWEQAVGPNHPGVGDCLNNLAGALSGADMNDEALALFERALAISQLTYDPLHPKICQAFTNLALILDDLGRLDEAKANYDRALFIAERALGPDHDQVAFVLSGLALLLVEEHRPREALARAERALAIRRRLLGSAHPQVAYTLMILARVDSELGRFTRALAHAQEAVRILQNTIDERSPQLTHALVEVGRAQLGLHAAHNALPILKRAVELRRDGDAAPSEMAEAEFLLARALWETGERARAHELADQALARLESSKTGHAKDLGDAVRAWLAARGNSG
jgi:tetratricopeptide (TPR) repeat protein/tRNA A-37 threonylcarbamoyl transferase component Bud32